MKRIFLLIGLVAGAVIGSKLLLENVLGLDLGASIANRVHEAGLGSALIVVLLLVVDLVLPVPSSLVMVASGAVFGTAVGAALSLVGSIVGQWLGFELVRRHGRRASRLIADDAELHRLERACVRYGAAAVVVTRALPIVMETMSVVAGLSGMGRSTFLIASLLGTAPVVLVYAYAGSVSRSTGSLVPAMVMLIAVAGGAYVWYRARVLGSLNETEPVHD